MNSGKTYRLLPFFIVFGIIFFSLTALASADMLTIHFLDVGQGDAALVQCGGQSLMIDGGDRDANQFIYAYLHDHGIHYLDYVISTHPHDDHVQGLATALVACDVGTVYSPVTEYNDGIGFQDFLKKVKERGANITIPHRGDTFALGNATVTFLSEPKSEWSINDQSLVVRITYGETAFLFMGDAEWEAEQDILASGIDVSADVIKLGHHGSISSTATSFMEAVHPTYAIISVGEGNSFGHPSKEVVAKLQRAFVSVFRTDIHGTITCMTDGNSLGFQMIKKRRPVNSPTATPVPVKEGASFGLSDFELIGDLDVSDDGSSGERSFFFDTTEAEEETVQYIGNRNSHVFHELWCDSVKDMKEKNKVELYSREEAIGFGYKPCNRCQP